MYFVCTLTLVISFYFAEGVADADLVLLVTTRPTTGNTLAWAVACERDQWGRAIAGNFFGLSFLCLTIVLTTHVLLHRSKFLLRLALFFLQGM